jgi:hypothetical protein
MKINDCYWEKERFLSENIIDKKISLSQYYTYKSHKNKMLLKINDSNDLLLFKNNLAFYLNAIRTKFNYVFNKFEIKIKSNYLIIEYEFNYDLIGKTIYWLETEDKIIDVIGFFINPVTDKFDLLLEGENNFMIWHSEIKLNR